MTLPLGSAPGLASARTGELDGGVTPAGELDGAVTPVSGTTAAGTAAAGWAFAWIGADGGGFGTAPNEGTRPRIAAGTYFTVPRTFQIRANIKTRSNHLLRSPRRGLIFTGGGSSSVFIRLFFAD